MRITSQLSSAAAVIMACVACASDNRGNARPTWTTQRTMIGDTAVVRTTGIRDDAATHTLVAENSIGVAEGADEYTFGSIREVALGPNDAIYILDGQSLALRQYDTAGKFVRTIGRKGSGPGEFTGVNGLAAHWDGRVVLWNSGSARINAYSATGESLGSWVVPGGGGFNTSGAVSVDTAGNTYIRTRVGDTDPNEDIQKTGRMFGITGLLRYGPDGVVRDSLVPPQVMIDIAQIVARTKNNVSMNSVPFATQFIWKFSPLGYFVSGRTDRYAIDLTAPDGKVVRIERDATPVAVVAEEKADVEARSTASMRRADPTWRWNGPAIPGTKPLFRSIAVGNDGRIWITVSLPGERIPDDELAPPTPPFPGSDVSIPPRRWREPTAFDVFEPDGRYLGRVALPTGATWRASRGDRLWAVTRDSLDIEQVTRFRVAPGFGEHKVDVGALNGADRRVMSLGLAPVR